jgi:hypothetical protein
VLQSDPDDEAELAQLQRNLRLEGVFRSLENAGAAEGDDVEIKGRTFVYIPDTPDLVEGR